jgi:3-(3-hydroxy-phenyl)propionate hydroxylase
MMQAGQTREPEQQPVYDVAIVGLGPTGATLANLLGAAGHSVLVLEKEAGFYPLPRAIHFDGEVLRIFQAAGLREQVLAISRPGTKGMRFVNGAGETMLIRGGTAAVGPHGCANNNYFHQPQLESVLRDGLTRFAQVHVKLRNEVIGVKQDVEVAELTYRSLESGEVHSAQARFVVGCDGARSRIRENIGSPLVDLGLRQPWLVVDVVLEDAVDLPDHTIQYCDPNRPMTYCNVVGKRRRWEIMVLPDDDREALVKPENLWKMVAKWVRPDQARMERAAIYTFHSVIADGWRARRLFLAGDACHQTPPFLGQGMCAGIRDAANLAWKLDAVMAREAPDSLLDTYESERKPHVRSVIELAVSLGNIIQTTDPALAAERDARFESGRPEVFEMPPQLLGPGAFDPEDSGVAGRPFPQPRQKDGRLLDDLLGWRCAVIGRKHVVSAAAAATAERWRRNDAIVIDHPDPALEEWLELHRVNVVVLRPDRYIVGVARTGSDLDRISQYLPVVP